MIELDQHTTSINLSHVWQTSGTFTIKVKTFDGSLYSEENYLQINVNDIQMANYGFIILLIIAIITFITLSTKTISDDRKRLGTYQ